MDCVDEDGDSIFGFCHEHYTQENINEHFAKECHTEKMLFRNIEKPIHTRQKTLDYLNGIDVLLKRRNN